jgi:heme/copper-type cytochrome/quinol oxidase subunit 4/cytochrome c2
MQAPAEHSPPPGASPWRYLAVGAVSLFLTAAAFYVILARGPMHPADAYLILALAAVQVALQAFLFMHLATGRRLYPILFGFGAFLAMVVALGSVAVVKSGTPAQLGRRQLGTQNLSPGELVSQGRSIVTSQCVGCHRVNGTGGSVGPDLNQVMAGKINVVPGGQPTNPAWLMRWVGDPQAVWPGARMPNLGLSAPQVEAVVKYLTTQLNHGG